MPPVALFIYFYTDHITDKELYLFYTDTCWRGTRGFKHLVNCIISTENMRGNPLPLMDRLLVGIRI